jgi:eukaryotic-like serine/threonine-protein kinase
MTLSSGSCLGPYEILSPIGAGGMGEVYRARDKKLDRDVAIKVLSQSLAADPDSLARFEREAKAVAALSHPNILSIFDFGTQEGVSYAVMELLEGETLRGKLEAGSISRKQAVEYALQIAKGLSAAHERGVVHRDLKPENLFIMKDGHLKILDFGLAKREAPVAPGEETSAQTASGQTQPGTVMGTVGYMSPEQVRGLHVDHRSDIFSFGTILYEMLSGKRAFKRATTADTMSAILKEEPPELSESGRSVNISLDHLVRHCLEKDRENRFQSARDIAFALAEASDPAAATGSPPLAEASGPVAGGLPLAELKAPEESLAPGRKVLSRRTWIALVAAGLAAIAAAGWLWQRASRTRWARDTAAPEIARLLDADELAKAAALVRKARDVLPKDPTLEKLWKRATGEITVESVPPGADVSIRPYGGDPNAWESLGKTPLTKFRFPRGSYLMRVTAPGYIPAVRICAFRFGDPSPFSFRLDKEGSIPAEMVHIPEGKTGVTTPDLDTLPEVQLDDYLIDRTEVTNAKYKIFVDAGGYQKRELWKHPFLKDGRTLSWEEAIALFHDSTGRPGPAAWELGQFPPEQDRHPVAGVSWYEAAAYAEFVGKSLPSVYHWCRAANLWGSGTFVPGSNFSDSGTVPVGGAGAVNEYGTYDMAGNVKEWCWNERKDHMRFILGGGFGEPTYMFGAQDAQPPWQRAPNFGFRCVKLISKPPDATLATIDVPPVRDYSKERPASDEAFRAYKGLYAYDKRDLAVHLDATEKADDWTTEIVSFDAGYGNERMIAYLCLPKNARPPYQTVVYFPGSSAIHTNKKLEFVANEGYAAIVPKSGRALLFPIYKGTYQRSDDLTDDTEPLSASYRDHTIAWAKDLSRSIDFLETRKDIDREKLAYLGFSWGGEVAPVMLAVEGRFKAAILISGGLDPFRTLPEAEPFNFVSRVQIPVLMLNGRYDHRFPVEAAQLPFFRSLGTPEKEKKHVIYESGHAPPRKDYIRESLDWLDKYLGPVKR